MKRSKWIVGFQFLPHFSIKVLSELRWRRICSQFKIIAQSVSGGEVIGNCKNNSSQSSTFIQQAGFPQATVPTLPLIPNFSCVRSHHEWRATFVRMKIEEKAGRPLQLLWDGTTLASKWLRGKVSFSTCIFSFPSNISSTFSILSISDSHFCTSSCVEVPSALFLSLFVEVKLTKAESWVEVGHPSHQASPTGSL